MWLVLTIFLVIGFYRVIVTTSKEVYAEADKPAIFSTNTLGEVLDDGWQLKLRSQGMKDQIEIHLEESIPSTVGIAKIQHGKKEMILGPLNESMDYVFEFGTLIDSAGSYEISLIDSRTGVLFKKAALDIVKK